MDKFEKNQLLGKYGYSWEKSRVTGDYELYNHLGVKVSESQALARAKQGFSIRERVIHWAIKLQSLDPLFLDTETTGVEQPMDLVEIAIVDLAGNVVYSSFCKPEKPIEPGAVIKCGITDEMVQDAPLFPQVWQEVCSIIAGQYVVIFNANYDVFVLADQARRYQLEPLPFKPIDIQRPYSTFVGEIRGSIDQRINCKQKMEHAVNHYCLEPQEHRAVGDALQVRQIFLAMYREAVEARR